MRESDFESAIASSLGELVREGISRQGPVPEEARARMLAALDGVRRPSKKFWILIPALAAAAAVLVVVFWPRPLSYEVAGRAPSGSYVSAPADQPLSLRFSDASKIELGKGSQLRVEETTPRGARVLLERGSLAVNVTHRESTEWTFVAGPCEVRVVGTRFALAWDPQRELFELRLDAGAVEVQTPLSSARVALRAGQEFRADLTKRSMTATETGAHSRAEAAPLHPSTAEAPGDSTAKQDPQGSAQGPSARSASPEASSPRASWRKLVAEGRFQDVLSEAESRGIPRCLQSSSASDLGALADAARYKGRSSVAEQSLLALRSRFPADPEGRSAAFMLGRLHQERGNKSAAKSWYDRYLSEAPNGTYAPDAKAARAMLDAP
jgi:TolA-binding protein